MSLTKTVKKFNSALPDINKVQDNLTPVIEEIAKVRLLDGVLLENILVGTSAKAIEHKLGREPFGFFVVRTLTSNNVYESSGANPNRKSYLLLQSGSAQTVSLWVF